MPIGPSIVGVWRLVSFREERDGDMVDVFGPEPRGFITYSADGHMSALLADPRRPRLKGAWSTITEAAKATNYDALVAYGGRYTLDGDRVRHHVEICWIPNWEGRDLVRFLTFESADRLVLRAPGNPERGQAAQEVVWSRAEGSGPGPR